MGVKDMRKMRPKVVKHLDEQRKLAETKRAEARTKARKEARAKIEATTKRGARPRPRRRRPARNPMPAYADNPKLYWEERHRRQGNKYVGAGNNQAICDSQEEVFWEALEPVIDELAPTKLLDFGCGTGRFSRRIIEKRVPYVGVDLNGIAIKELSDAYAGYNDVEFHELQPYTELPFEEGSFEIILAVTVLQHVVGEHYNYWSRELSRVAADDAVFVIIDDANPGNKAPASHMEFRTPEHIADSLASSIVRKSLVSAETNDSHWFFVSSRK